MTEAPIAILMVAVGFQLAFQAPVNRALGRSVGPLPAVLVSFLIGTLLLVAMVLLSGQTDRIGDLDGRSPLLLAGGICGAAYVTVAALTVGRIGAGAVASATVAGQLLGSLLVDHLGLFGIEAQAVGARQAAGALLLILGTILVAGTGNRPEPSRASDSGREDSRARVMVAAVLLAGFAVGFQHPLNSNLADSSGELPAALVNFLVGSVAVGLVVLMMGSGGGLRGIGSARPWTLAGGPIGVVTVLASLISVPLIGATALVGTTVAGQLAGSVAIDRFGLAGLSVLRTTPVRWLGLGSLLIGTFAVL